MIFTIKASGITTQNDSRTYRVEAKDDDQAISMVKEYLASENLSPAYLDLVDDNIDAIVLNSYSLAITAERKEVVRCSGSYVGTSLDEVIARARQDYSEMTITEVEETFESIGFTSLENIIIKQEEV